MGIFSVLEELRASPLRQIYPQAGTAPSPIQQTELHSRHVSDSLLHSLDVFQSRLDELKKWYNAKGFAGPRPFLGTLLQLEAGIAASSIFHFLNLFLDDVARIVLLVLRLRPHISFGNLLNKVGEGKIPTPRGLKQVFDELRDQNSWWNVGFKSGEGIRQRLVHYTDMVTITASRRPGSTRFRTTAYLHAMDRKVPTRNLEAEISRILLGLCEWLDRVEEALKDMLADEARRKHIQWNPRQDPSRLRIPVGLTNKWRIIPKKHFLYLPICEGSHSFSLRTRATTSSS